MSAIWKHGGHHPAVFWGIDMSRPDKCSKCLYDDCMLSDDMVVNCEVTATAEKEKPSFLENIYMRISQTNNNVCPNIYGSVEVWDDSLGVTGGVARNRRCGGWDCPVCWLYEEMKEAGCWIDWHKYKQGVVYCQV